MKKTTTAKFLFFILKICHIKERAYTNAKVKNRRIKGEREEKEREREQE